MAQTTKAPAGSSFYLDKWFLDFVSTDGTAMIFYAAQLKWRGLAVSYTGWLSYRPETGAAERSRLRQAHMPIREGDRITWQDPKFGIKGRWQAQAQPLEARIYTADEGYLHWYCWQPASTVELQIDGKTLHGQGYAEQLHMTLPPWRMPMEELRWGRFASPSIQMVWIEIRAPEKRQWLWLNGEPQAECGIGDDVIKIPALRAELQLDRGAVLTSGKDIFAAVEKILTYLPGLNRVMPLSFLMADNYKWLSRAEWQRPPQDAEAGIAIHEWVNFKIP